MSARTVLGLVFIIVGFVLLIYGGYEFNNLFFVAKFVSVSAIPTYSPLVVTPFLVGIIALLDGSVILGLKRSFSFSFHLLGNFVWLYAIYLLYDNLSIPITDISAYHQIFLLSFLGLIFFTLGAVTNDIPKRRAAT